MGEAKRRKKLDPRYGKSIVSPPDSPSAIAVRLEKSDLTGKWKTMTSINGAAEICVTVHKRHSDATQAAQEIVRVFEKITPQQWSLSDTLSTALMQLDIEDDDEVIGVLRPNSNGEVSIDQRPETLSEYNCLLEEASQTYRHERQQRVRTR